MISLASRLGVSLDPHTASRYLGRINDADRLSLLAHVGEPWRHMSSEGNQLLERDRPFYPNAEQGIGNNMLALALKPMIDVPSLHALVPLLDNPTMQLQTMAFDFCSLHTDPQDSTHEVGDVLAVLLQAPKGCLFVSNTTRAHEMAPGDVVIFDDQRQHGAYPLETTERFELEYRYDKHYLAELERYARDNAMVFAIFTQEVD
jgi:hypothetical protein